MRAVAAAIALIALGGPAFACRCYPQSRQEIIDRADIVIEGTVAEVAEAGAQIQATIDVTRQFKGPPLAVATVRTPSSSAACGVSFGLTQRVIVAANRDGAVWRTHLCQALGLTPVQPFARDR